MPSQTPDTLAALGVIVAALCLKALASVDAPTSSVNAESSTARFELAEHAREGHGCLDATEPPIAALHIENGKLDINRASVGDFVFLPGVGPRLAARIVMSRRRDGSYPTLDALTRVRGVGRATLDAIRPLLCVGPAERVPPKTRVRPSSRRGYRTSKR